MRERNEDAFFVDEAHGVFAVADGMGGHAGGERASALVVETLQQHLAHVGHLLLDDAAAAAAAEALQAASTVAVVPLEPSEATPTGAPTAGGAQVLAEGDDPSVDIDVADAGLREEGDGEGDGEGGGDAEAEPPAAPAAEEPPLLPIGGEAHPQAVLHDAWDSGAIVAPVAPLITKILADGVRGACRAIFMAALEEPELQGMGTTTTALCVHRGWAYVAHVGDSRCYVQREGETMLVTEDHSLVNEQVRAGLLTPELARTSRHKNIITRSVGFERDVEVDSFMLPTRPGDTFLLCSDGLSNLVEDEELAQAMAQLQGDALAEFLVALALARGGDDNVTVVCVQVDGAEAVRAPTGEPSASGPAEAP